MSSLPDQSTIEQFAHLTDQSLVRIAELLRGLERLPEGVGEFGLFLTGSLEVRHQDGWRLGWISAYEDWWVFVPDYSEDLT